VNGYFSMLLKQSVSPAGPTVGSAPALPAQPPARIDLEESVESRRDEQIGGTRNGPEAISEVSGPIVEEPVRGPAEQIVHREVPEPPRRLPGDRQQQRSPEGRESDPRGSDRTPPRRVGDIGELLARVDAVEGETGARRPGLSERGALELYETVEGATHRADEFSPSDAGASAEAPASLPDEETWDPVGRERVWRSTFEEVRGWVAGSPVADDEAAEIRDVSRARATASVDAGLPFVEERAATARPVPDVLPPREEPETQDLRLEIGTISVTVEEPQREIPRPNLRTEVQEKKPAGEGERSRLGRHYIRVR
jgi:hypothetical protein